MAVLLYIVVAVTAAADNHVGTRIFLCGFMVGPMWLALSIGGVVVSSSASAVHCCCPPHCTAWLREVAAM